MSYVVWLHSNSYKHTTNTAWDRARLCKLQKGCTRLAPASDKVYQLLAHGRWFSPSTPVSSTTKSGCHDIAEILLRVALKHKKKSYQIKPNTLDWGFDPHTKDYKINLFVCYFFCLSAKQEVLRKKNKYWLTQNQNSGFEWCDMSNRGLLFQYYNNPTRRVGLVQSCPHHHLENQLVHAMIELKICWVGVKQQLFTHRF